MKHLAYHGLQSNLAVSKIDRDRQLDHAVAANLESAHMHHYSIWLQVYRTGITSGTMELIQPRYIYLEKS